MARKALIVGVANDRSLAWAIAQALHRDGCELAFTYNGEALERRVRPLAEGVGAKIIEPCDVNRDEDLDRVMGVIRERWGELDVLVHAVAFAQREDLEGRFVNTGREGFRVAMETSVFSLLALARRAEPLLEGRESAILTLSYHGAQQVIPNYNVMGVAKAALESSVRYLAMDLGPKKIRVNAVSAGPVKTLAACGIRDFRSILTTIEQKSPLHENITAEDVGEMGAFLCGTKSRHMTGSVHYVDSGAHIVGV